MVNFASANHPEIVTPREAPSCDGKGAGAGYRAEMPLLELRAPSWKRLPNVGKASGCASEPCPCSTTKPTLEIMFFSKSFCLLRSRVAPRCEHTANRDGPTGNGCG